MGKVLGIKIELHWTFALLLIWMAFIDLRQGAGWDQILLNEALILLLFVCVVLHELGHALTAKRFNIKTQEIRLLPIGGIATLERIPEKPIQELLVALAGPAVNVIIIAILAIIVPIDKYFNFNAVVLEELLYEVTIHNFLFYLLIANVMLVVFNLIPAFPMDGGRVLRALLSFRIGRVKATQIAAGIGQFLAILLFVMGLIFNPFLVLIAFFIFVSAYGENQMVKQKSLLEGFKVADAVLRNITKLRPDDMVEKAIYNLLTSSEKDFVVVQNNAIVGTVTQKEIIKNAANPSLLIKDMMNPIFTTVHVDMDLEKVLMLLSKEKVSFFPVTDQNHLVGIIDKTNISEFLLIKNSEKAK